MSGKNTLTFTFLQELDEKIGTALTHINMKLQPAAA